MMCLTVWHPATRPSCIVRPSAAAQRASARLTSPPSDAQKLLLTSPLLARTYSVSPFVRSRTSSLEKPAEVQAVVVSSSEDTRAARCGNFMAEVSSRGRPPQPSFGNPAVRPVWPDPWLCVPTSRWVCPCREGLPLVGKLPSATYVPARL